MRVLKRYPQCERTTRNVGERRSFWEAVREDDPQNERASCLGV